MEIGHILGTGWPPTERALHSLLEEACVDAYDEYEQAAGIHCVIEEWGGLPCSAVVAGQPARFTGVDLREASVVAIVRLAGAGMPVPLEDVVPDPGTPAAFMVAMYRLWCGKEPVVVASTSPPLFPDAGGWSLVAERVEAANATELGAIVRELYEASDANRRLVHGIFDLPAPRDHHG